MPSFPKSEPRAKVKARQIRAHQAARKACRDMVYVRENSRCQGCGTLVYPVESEQANIFLLGHVHEVLPRSLGGDDTNPANCQLLCQTCHAEAHRLNVAHGDEQ